MISELRRNICKTGESDTHISFNAICNCLNKDNQQIVVELYANLISVTFYAECSPYYFWYNFFERLKIAIKIILKMPVLIETDFLMDKEQTEDYIKTLSEALKKFIS